MHPRKSQPIVIVQQSGIFSFASPFNDYINNPSLRTFIIYAEYASLDNIL